MTEAVAANAAPVVDAVSTLAQLGIPVGANENVESVGEETSAGGEATDGAGGSEGAEREGADATAATEGDGADKEAASQTDATKQPSDAKREAYKKLFTDEALKTPEGVKAAAAAVRQREQKNHEIYLRTIEREKAAKGEIAQARAEKQNYAHLSGQVLRSLETIFKGSNEQALSELGRLRGKDGLAVYEDLTEAAIGLKRKNAESDNPAVKELKAELDRIKAEKQAERIEAENTHWRGQVAAAAAAKNASGYEHPGIAHMVNTGVVHLRDVVRAVEEDFVNNGVAPRDSLAKLDRIWAAQVPAAPEAQNGAKKPPPAGKLPGRGVAPSKAASGAGQREMTQDERMNELANDPAFKQMFGL